VAPAAIIENRDHADFAAFEFGHDDDAIIVLPAR